MRAYILIVAMLFSISPAYAQSNGKLQIHFIDVGQGDAAILISPKGETVLFDNGVANACEMPVSYIRKIGITNLDYHVATHYHADHIGCTSEVFKEFSLGKVAYDRGSSTTKDEFKKYEKAVGSKRMTATPGDKIVLDAKSANPVYIEFVASNGDGVDTTNENDLSLVSVIRFGKFDAVIGGDLSGYNKSGYKDIESLVAGKVGKVEVYKVNHHCSKYSTNDKWLSVVSPKVGIISASAMIGTNYHHPTQECIDRLHNANVKTYWTERGDGATPNPKWDTVSGDIVVEAEANKSEFKVIYKEQNTDTYTLWD